MYERICCKKLKKDGYFNLVQTVFFWTNKQSTVLENTKILKLQAATSIRYIVSLVRFQLSNSDYVQVPDIENIVAII